MKQNVTLSILTIGHFLVDLACLYFFFVNYPQNGFVAGISAALLYNFLAFALQAVIGYFFDRFPAKRSTSIGILFVLCGYACGLYQHPVAGLVLCGFGNAFYHVGGSIGIARTDKQGLRNSGIFVSAGALGVSLGAYLSSGHVLSEGFLCLTTILILLLLIALLLLQTQVVSSIKQIAISPSAKTNTVLLLLSLFAVFIRSLGGLFFPSSYRTLFSFPEHSTLAIFLPAMASGIVAFFGKFLGGFLSNLCTSFFHKCMPHINIDTRCGNYIFGILTLLLSAALLTVGGDISILCFLGILFFHAAMPVTLFELYCIFPDRPGFAMGLSTVMLFLGYLPYAFVPLDGLPASLILCLLTILAAGCMLFSLLIYRKANRVH